MSTAELDRLFAPELGASTSSGVVHPEDVDDLSPLKKTEVPAGFDGWAEKRKREFRAGRHHARCALAAAGKPEFALERDDEGVPMFPPGYHGSITHTGRASTFAAAVALHGETRIGLDAEVLRDLPEDMRAHIVTNKERGMLSEVPSAGTPNLRSEGERALLAFSAKEAFYKCIYPRLRCRLEFHEVEFRMLSSTNTDGSPGRFEVTLLSTLGNWDSRPLKGTYLCDPRHVICAVAWDGK